MEKKSQNPRISVIIPTYNREHVLSRAINSVLNQSFKDFELLIVDDGSSDNTKEVVKEFQEQDGRVKYFGYTPNQGGNVARNLGIKKAQGRYVTFLDSDDEYYSNNLEERWNVLDVLSDEYKVIYNKCLKKTPSGNKVLPQRKIKEEESVIRYLFLAKNRMQTNLFFIDRKFLEENDLYFDESLKRHQDWDLAIRSADKTKFYFLDKALSIWHDEEGGDRVSKQKDYSASFYLIKKYRDKFEKEKDVLSKFYYRIAIWHLRGRQSKEARKIFLRSIKTKVYAKSLFLYISTFLGEKWIDFLFKILDHKMKKEENEGSQ